MIGAPKDQTVCVVRLTTTCWCDRRSLHQKKSLTFLRRKCKGHNLLEEDADNDPDLAIGLIQNLSTLADGDYQVCYIPKHVDRETGEVDDYVYTLVPFKQTEKE